jgi:CubicO group peptidase (beta-lactamase class C family)
MIRFLAIAMAVMLAATPARADERSAAVDKIFACWDRADTPGMTVAVLQDGRPLYVRGYGMASLEFSLPNGADTVFPLASNSKQFTAFAIYLLAQGGKLSLDDDVRKFVPELPEFGAPITLDMLVHHTSGLRESVSLLDLQGHAPEDVATPKMALDLLVRQKTLNFAPGARYTYSNSNYLLLALVVERVSGQSLGDFWRTRIFQPLGMTATSVSGDPMPAIARRAYGYGRGADGKYVPRNTPDLSVGPSGINSTVADLATWLANYDDARIGGRAVIAAMLEPGRLADGTPITYAGGLHREHYRGLPFIEHSGANWGYKTDILSFPGQRLAVIILANADDSEPAELAFRIADIYLKDAFLPPKPRPAAVAMPVALLDRYVGTFEVATGTTLRAPGRQYRFRREDFLGEAAPLLAASETEFFARDGDFRIRFLPEETGVSRRAIVLQPSGEWFAARRVADATPALPPADPAGFGDLAGDYWSQELGAIYSIAFRAGKLWMRYPRGEMELRPQAQDTFLWRQSPVNTVSFTRDSGGAISGFLLSEPRIRNLRFRKVSLD